MNKNDFVSGTLILALLTERGVHKHIAEAFPENYPRQTWDGNNNNVQITMVPRPGNNNSGF